MAVQPFSILFPESAAGPADAPAEPECLPDLNLDQVVASLTAGRAEYNLKPFFWTPLREPAGIRYRHEVMRDLERPAIREGIDEFAQEMQVVHRRLRLVQKLRYRHQRQRWFLDAAGIYCAAVERLREDVTGAELGSRGLRRLRAYLAEYIDSDRFRSLAADTHDVQERLARVKYGVHVHGGRVRVTRYDGEPDYASEVEKTFERFQRGQVDDYLVGLRDGGEMTRVEAQVLDLVARLFPDAFHRLEQYCARYEAFIDPVIGRFDREVQFYLACLDHVRRLSAAGLAFCFPEVTTEEKRIRVDDGFDLALADKLVDEGSPVVCNSFDMHDPERILVVTGPNQGGKTTFARMFGQLAYLAALGCPVPARGARLFVPDRVFTHFEREEALSTQRGKLEDELVRIHRILEQATSDSVIVMNETFTSTTFDDALRIGTEVLTRVVALGALAVYVTFVDELASLCESTVSMVGGVVPDDPAQRTYQIVRRPPDGLAYAAALAQKYGLTYEALRRRIHR